MPLTQKFFKKRISGVLKVGGPSADEQLLAMGEDRYWTVLNAFILQDQVGNDLQLTLKVNALKFALQTYGPLSEKLPVEIRPNKGKAEGFVFHGDFNDSHGVTHVLEWAIIDPKKRILALVGFGSHENYHFCQKPLSSEDIKRILSLEENKKISERVQKATLEAKEKIKRVNYNYRNAQSV